MGKFNSEGQNHSSQKREMLHSTALNAAPTSPFLLAQRLPDNSRAWSCSAVNKYLNLLALNTLLNSREQLANSVLPASIPTARPLNSKLLFLPPPPLFFLNFKCSTCIWNNYCQLPNVIDHSLLSGRTPEMNWGVMKLTCHSLEILELDASPHVLSLALWKGENQITFLLSSRL